MPIILRPGQPSIPARPDHHIPLGAALLVTDLPCLPEEFDLAAVAAANPWVPIATFRPEHPGILTPYRRHPALRDLFVLDGPEAEWEARVRKELTSLGPPTPDEVVDYIANALPDATLERALRTELKGFARPVRSARHRTFVDRGPLTAVDWWALYTVTKFLAFPGRPRPGDAAMRLGIDPRTLRDCCRRAVHLHHRDAQKGFGWRWAVEFALRRHGYLRSDPPLPLAFRASYPSPPPRENVA